MSNVAPETSRNSSENENTHPINWEMISFDDDLRNDLKSALEVVQQRNDIQIEYSGLAESELASALSEVSVQSGVPIHRVRLRPGWHRANHGDMLVLVNQNNQPRLCALLHANSGYIVHDFRQGSVKKLDAATRKQLAPFGWTVVRTFENSESFQGKFSQQPILLGELFKYLLHGIRKHSKLLLIFRRWMSIRRTTSTRSKPRYLMALTASTLKNFSVQAYASDNARSIRHLLG